MKKILLFILDGLADRPTKTLNGKTPLQEAKKTYLNWMASLGSTGLFYSISPGISPSTELAHFSFLGYLQEFPGRAYLEALGRGMEREEVVIYVNISSVKKKGKNLLPIDRHPEGKEEEFKQIFKTISKNCPEGFEIIYDEKGEGFLFLKNSKDAYLTDSDPFFPHIPVLKIKGTSENEKTIKVINNFLLKMYKLLENHSVNKKREAHKKPPLNFLLTKWAGKKREVTPFSLKYGLKGAVIASTYLFKGIAKHLHMEYFEVKENLPKAEIEEKVNLALRLSEKFDFILVHTKTLDEVSHKRDPRLKKRIIEEIDASFKKLAQLRNNLIISITSDHATPSEGTLIHSGDPSPLLIFGKGVPKDGVKSFDEISCGKGYLGILKGIDLMLTLLNYADRIGYLRNSHFNFLSPSRPSNLNIEPLDLDEFDDNLI
jgi:2,3-bisphosphoglycerate-independent phosphoglycerate mutase